MLTLTDEEKEHLQTLQGRLAHVADAVKGVAKQFHTGLFLHGEGGTGKSYTVLETLQQLKVKYVYHNTRMTGRGLVDALERAPSDIHLIEDAETLLDDKKSFGVLRSALWSQSKKKPPERVITWTAFKTAIRFVFTGGIIVISNQNLAETVPEIRAIKTRINVLKLDLSAEELLALMKKICLEGFVYGEDYMTPDECWMVGEFIKEKLNELNRPVDLRLLINGFKDYLQWKTGNACATWQVLLLGRIQERPQVVRRAVRTANEAELAAELSRMDLSRAERLRLWEEKTGHKGERSYFRALERAENK